MTDPVSIAADYSLKPSELAATLAVLVEARQPAMIWGPPRLRQIHGRPTGRRPCQAHVC